MAFIKICGPTKKQLVVHTIMKVTYHIHNICCIVNFVTNNFVIWNIGYMWDISQPWGKPKYIQSYKWKDQFGLLALLLFVV